jgi:hypothetical protein
MVGDISSKVGALLLRVSFILCVPCTAVVAPHPVATRPHDTTSALQILGHVLSRVYEGFKKEEALRANLSQLIVSQ